MDLDEIIHDTLNEILQKLEANYSKIECTEEEKGIYLVNIKSEMPSQLIGHHGNTILAIQHMLKVFLWKKTGREDFQIFVDVDGYRSRQEENALNLALRKAEKARQTGRPQALMPMSSYLRRRIHLHFMGAGFEDLETYSSGQGPGRHIIIKPKN